MRAKASGIGYRKVGVVTPAEKPTRIALGVMFLFASGLLPEKATQLASVASIVWLLLGAISLLMLLMVYRKNIKQ
jgi:hypothetical protein